ncbi:hypothetical protein SAMN04487948_105141 [Halogranum amylolyticum]|uniref:Uncharacterized protein n=1 Tax=Halogranum amylolyticum TaxID=660520 RepID=A0A1H8SJT6_9EURY|nr:hypothetical protein [Halogranum amylolyticum]SEO78776.1 hypothetical protein SAMN04487948_105141 [Halogranum amylolyticum]
MSSTPAVPTELLDGWRLVDERTETPFDVTFVTVTAHTTVYEDPDLAAALREQTGVDGPGRFFLTSHVVLRPQPPESEALRRLVTDRVAQDFAGRLRDRGFTSVEQTSQRSFSVDGADARLAAYEGAYPLGDGVELRVQGWLAVWQVDGDFLLAGGAYPTHVHDPAGETTDAVREQLSPQRFRDELFELIRAVERP